MLGNASAQSQKRERGEEGRGAKEASAGGGKGVVTLREWDKNAVHKTLVMELKGLGWKVWKGGRGG